MIYGSVYDSINESSLYYVDAYEFDESMTFQEMGAQMIEEATRDWNDYVQAIALTELSYVMETGQEYIYEGVDISAMLTKVKDWFAKLWAKIQGIARAAMAKFMSWGKNDEAFINKYEKEIYDGARKLPAGFSYKGYKFEGLMEKADFIKSVSGTVAKAADCFGSIIEKRNSDMSDETHKDWNSKRFGEMLDTYRGRITKNSNKVSSSDFKKTLKKFLYGSLDKEYIKNVDAGKMITLVKNYADTVDTAKDAQDTIKDDIDVKIDMIDDLEKKIRDIETKPEDSKGREHYAGWATVANNYSTYLKDIESINAMWFSAYMTALKDQNRQAKALCTKLISFANGVGGKKSTNESVSSLLEDRFAAFDF